MGAERVTVRTAPKNGGGLGEAGFVENQQLAPSAFCVWLVVDRRGARGGGHIGNAPAVLGSAIHFDFGGGCAQP